MTNHDEDDGDDILFAMIAQIQLFSMLPLPFQWFSMIFKHSTLFLSYNNFQWLLYHWINWQQPFIHCLIELYSTDVWGLLWYVKLKRNISIDHFKEQPEFGCFFWFVFFFDYRTVFSVPHRNLENVKFKDWNFEIGYFGCFCPWSTVFLLPHRNLWKS